MSVVGRKEKFRVYIAIASELFYLIAPSLRQAPQHLAKKLGSTAELTCIAGSISAASIASQREPLSLLAILQYETRVNRSNRANAILDPRLVPFRAHFNSKPAKFPSRARA